MKTIIIRDVEKNLGGSYEEEMNKQVRNGFVRRYSF